LTAIETSLRSRKCVSCSAQNIRMKSMRWARNPERRRRGDPAHFRMTRATPVNSAITHAGSVP
jgi:hypothetical protein